ncbi:MAG: hypothetical protein PHX14_08105 [Syntrophomonadaceae bacterium]|nr:hypothetical protein [Syntrophomonadaceae bacterium]
MRIIDSLDTEKQNYESSENSKNQAKKTKTNVLIFLIMVGLWIGIVYYGYIYSKNYLDTAINNIRQENAMNIKEIHEDISILGSEIRSLRGSMEDAGMVISNSSDVQSRIDEKLLDLESQLEQLEKSLEILKEAPHDAEN